MADQINLLPQDLKTGKDITRTVNTLNRVAVFVGVVFVVVAALVGGLLFFLNRQLEETRASQEQVKTNVANLENTEQRLVLVKDRIQRAQNILQDRTKYKTLDKIHSLVSSLPETSLFRQVELDSDISKVTITTTDSDSLAQVLSFVNDDEIYEQVIIDELNFDSITGFEVTLIVF